MSPTGEGDAGFTLIELMVTLVLAGLLMALAPPLLEKGGDRARLAHDSRGLISSLRLARSNAIVGGQDEVVRFDLAHRRYGIEALNQSIDAGVTMTLETPLADQAEIRFFADGSASGGIIHLINRSGVVALEVDWLTGNVGVLP